MKRNKRIVLVGEAFGREEEKYGRPFIGQAGRLLTSVLAQCGLERHDVHITNVCMFRPTDVEGRNRPPTDEEISCELLRLKADIREFDIVILLGATAHKTLSPASFDSLSSCLGERLYYLDDRKMFISIWHPAYILRNMNLLPEYISLLYSALDKSK